MRSAPSPPKLSEYFHNFSMSRELNKGIRGETSTADTWSSLHKNDFESNAYENKHRWSEQPYVDESISNTFRSSTLSAGYTRSGNVYDNNLGTSYSNQTVQSDLLVRTASVDKSCIPMLSNNL